MLQKRAPYLGTDKSLARPGRKQARKHVRDARDFNNIETRAVIKFLFLQSKASKEIHAILTETLACFHPGRAKDLSALLYVDKDQNFNLCCYLIFQPAPMVHPGSSHLVRKVTAILSLQTHRSIGSVLPFKHGDRVRCYTNFT